MIAFAVAGLALALGSGGLYVYRDQNPPAASAAAAQQSPEDAVRVFLTAVFLANDASRLAGVVCASWDPQNALQRTRSEIDTTAIVTWDAVRVVTSEPARASVSARLGLRKPDEMQPSTYTQWRFSVVDESGWRVCEARPFIS